MPRKIIAILAAVCLAPVGMSAGNKADYMLPLVYTLNRVDPKWIKLIDPDNNFKTFEQVLAGNGIPLPLGEKVPSEMFSRIQYKIACGSKKNTAPTQVPQDVVESKLAYAKCSNFLSPPRITLSSKGVNVQRTLTPVPAYQNIEGFEVKDSDPGVSLNKISSCCTQAACPQTCIETPESDCRLELYGPMIYEGSNPENAAIFVTEGFVRLFVGSSFELQRNYYLSMDFIMSIPCQYCSYRSCTTDCSNGQVTFLLPYHLFVAF